MMSRPFYGLLAAGLLLTCGTVKAQTQNKDVLDYIAKYNSVAIEEQQRTGIPAAITLAQGIHESACGKSELSLNAHNHFGIKCKNTWTGETYTYTDDAKDECFRKYESDMHSYKDHSDFLKGNARYAALFALEQSDYKGWAFGLKKCGYATNPQYAIKLIDLIERYDLQQYTLATNYKAVSSTDGAIASTDKYFGVSSSTQDTVPRKTRRRTDDGNVFANVPAEEDAAPAAAAKYTMAPAQQGSTGFYELTTRNGLKGFYAPKGELLLSAANKFNVRYAKLLDINDLADAPLPEDMFIYLSRKNKTGYEPTHTVKYGETVSIIAQDQGIRMKDLLAFNQLLPGEEPAEGSVLYLQGMAPQKPDLSRQQFNTSKYNTIDRSTPASGQEYIATGNKPKYTSEPNDPKMKALQEQEMQALDKRTAEAAATEEFNIANEPAVEEQIAAERGDEEEVAAPKGASATANTELSSLDKLKAKLDRSVYGNTPPAEQNATTRPAAKNKPGAAVNANPEVNPAASIDTRSAHASLKSKIDQHQKELQDQPAPVVEPYRAPQTSAPVRTPAPNVAKSNNGVHIVKKGDTAFSIAKNYGISLDQLIKWNKLPSSGAVTVGSKLKVK
jgi:LysM repeat protein